MLPVFCFFTFTHLFCLPAFLLALLAGSGGVDGLAEGGGRGRTRILAGQVTVGTEPC